MAQLIGTIKEMSGIVIARNAIGEERILKVGDAINFQDTISTIGAGSHATLSLVDGRDIVLSGNDGLLLDKSVYAQGEAFGDEAIIASKTAEAIGIGKSVTEIQEALLRGEDISNLEETAAGNAGEGGSSLASGFALAQYVIGGNEANVLAEGRALGESGAENILFTPPSFAVDPNDTPLVSDMLSSQREALDGLNTFSGNLATIPDGNGDVLTYSMVGNSLNVSSAVPLLVPMVTLNGNGTYNVSGDFNALAVGQSATVTFQYVANDGKGFDGSDGINASSISAPATVTLTITGTNDQPVVENVSVSQAELTAGINTFEGNLIAQDDDVSDTHTYHMVANTVSVDNALITTLPTVIVGSDGAYSIKGDFNVLAVGESATVTFQYYAVDNSINQINGESNTSEIKTVTLTITGTNDAPIIMGSSDIVGTVKEAGNLDDGTVVAAVSATGTLVVSDVDNGATHTWVGNTIGTYGTFVIDPATGVWTYNVDSTSGSAADKLKEGESRTEIFPATVTDEHGATDTQVVTITILGTNDAPVAVADVNSVTEAGSGNFLHDIDVGNPLALGNLLSNDSDVDGNANPIIALDVTKIISNGTNSSDTSTNWLGNLDVQGSYGTLVVNKATGVYSYILDNGNSLVNALNEGESIVDTFTYTVKDANGALATSTLNITVQGSNDAPVISGALSGTATEAGNLDDGTVVAAVQASGVLIATDADNNAATWSIQGNATGVYGALAIDANGTWTYSVDSQAGSLADQLAEGDVRYETFTIVANDDNAINPKTDTQTITIKIVGTNDAPVATVTDNFGVMEESTVHGQLVANDVDRDDASTTLTYTLVDGKPVPAGFTLNANGSYTFDATHNAYQSLSAGETQDVTFTWIATDSHGATTTEQSVTITITGTNDAPIAVADTNHVSESDSGIYVKTGLWGNVINTGAASGTTGVDSDVDHNTTLSIIKLVDENTGETLTHTNYNWDGSGFHIVGEYGNIMLWPDGKYLYNLYNDRAATNALSEGEIVTETFSYTVSDGQGGEASTTLTITITGTNDAPVLSIGTGDSVLANLIETDAGLLANGTLSLGDVDSTDVVTTAINTISTEGTYTGALPSNLLGMLTLTGGLDSTHTHTTLDWSFNSGSEAFNFLAKGETLVLNYTLLATDSSGTSSSHSNDQIVSITITGTNDAPTIMAHATDSSVLESALLNGSNPLLADTKAEGTFTIGDPDGLGDIKSISIAGSTYSIGAGVGLSDMVGFTANTAYGEMRITGYSNGVFTYAYTLITPVDNAHALDATGTLGKDSFVISVFDGTVTASTAVTIDITDDTPKVTQVSVTTPEGANELSGTFVMIGADGGGVTSVTYKGNAITVGQATEIDSGTITINSNGTYTFTPKSSLIHGSTNNFVESVLYTVTDGDGDSVNGKLSINVTDTIATVKAVAQSLDEDDLSNGTDPTKEPTTLTDISLGITEGKDAISDIKFVLGDIQAKFGTLKSQGIALSYEVSLDGHTLSAKAGANTVFTMSLDGVSRTYDFTLVGQLDHANGGSQNSYALNIPFTIIEIDDAIKASISLKIVDDVPVTTNDVSATIKEDSGDTLSGNVLSNDTWGADGPSGGIESVTSATYGATVLSLNTINHLAIGDITINSDGTWSFTPTADYGGKPVFTYTIKDADGDSISGKLTLNITPLSDIVVVGGDQVFKGYEDNVNNITQVLKDNITFKDFDGSETHTIILGNLQGATVYVNGVAQTGTTVSIVIPSSNAEANYPTIGIKAAANSDADLNGITVKATSKDTGSAITEQATFKLNLGITAIADAPTLTLGNNTTLTSQITDSFGGGNTVSKSATASLSGTEDSEIPLKITLNSADTSETVTSLSIADIPVGASITNGHGTVLFTATMGNTVYTIINPNSSDVASYAIKPASNDATDFALKVTATAAENPTELGDVVTPNSATTTVNVTVNVIADADDTIVTVSNTHLKEDGGSHVDHGMAQSLTLNVTHEGSESATYALSGFLKGSKVTIDGHDILITSNTQVVNASSDVALQGLTFIPPTDYSGTMQIHVVATVKEESTTLNKAFDFNYIIEPTADTPVLLVSDIKGHEGSEIVLADMVLATISMDNVSQTLDGTPEILTLTLTLKNTGSSFDSGATFSSGVITSDANGLHVTLTGTQAQLQTALQGLKFIPGAHASSVTNAYDFTITLASTDSKVIDGTAYTSTSPLVSKDATLTLIGVAEKASSIEAKGVGSEDAATYITLKASSNDADGSESLYGVLKGVPTGEGYGLHVVDASAQVVGTQLVLANVGNGTADWRIDAQTLAKLTSGEYKLLFTTPANESGLYAMNFVAINAERDGSVSQVVTPFTTIVAPAIEAYSGYSVNGSEFKETNWINLQLSNTGSDHDLFSNTTLSNIPDGAIIAVKNSDGTYTTLIPASGSIALTQEQIDRGVYARFDENASSVTLGATTVHVSQTVTDNGDMSGLTPVSETIERDITLNVKGVADGLLGVSAHDGSVDSNNAVALSSSVTKGSLIDTDGSEEAYYLIQNKNDDNTTWVMEGGISLGGGRWLVKATDFDSATIRLTSLSGDGSLDLQVQAVTKEKDGDTNFGGTHDFTITYVSDGSIPGGGGHTTSPITINTVGTTNEDTSFGLTATGQVLGKAYAFVFDPEIRDAGGNVIATVSSSNYYQLEDGRYVTTDINSLTITPASQYAGSVPLSIAVTQTDSNGAWSDVTPTAPLIVDVHAVLDTVHVSTITVSETDGGWIGFNPHFSSDDTNGTFASEGFLGGSTVTFSFANPSIIEGLRANGVSVTANPDGSYTLNASDVSHLEILPKAYTEGSTTVTASYIWADGTLTHAESKDFTLTFASHVDSIDVSANQSTYTGEEGGKVALGISFSDPTASVYIHQADSDGSEVASVVISGLPSDARLVNSSGNSIGSIKEVSTDVNGETTASWILTKAEAQDAYIQTEEHYSGAFNMGFQAYSYDKASGEISTSGDAITVSVDVHGVASSLSMSTTDVITNEDASVPVILNIAMADTDGSEWISVAINDVYGGAFSMGHSDGMGGWVIDTAGLQPSDLTSLLYTPKENNSGILEMNVSVTTHDYGTLTTQTATDTLSIAVEAIADMPYITSQTMMHANTGTALTLPLVAWLSDTDGSETLSVIINTYGKGELSAGVNNGDGTWTLSASQLTDLQITPSVTENFTISITAVATENANADQSIATHTIMINAGNETLYASDAGETLYGDSGNDILYGGAGDDVLHGGEGNDYLDGGAGSDRLYGGVGNDTLVYDTADNVIDGGAGLDTLLINADATVDLSQIATIANSIEVLDLTKASVEVTNINVDDILKMTADDVTHILKITGESNDSVSGTGWSPSTDTTNLDAGYTRYEGTSSDGITKAYIDLQDTVIHTDFH